MNPDHRASGRDRSPRVLAFMNQKGGCGKTTTAVHLAGALSKAGERVLLVDLDPQAHATMALGCAVFGEPSLVDVLRQQHELRDCLYAAPGGIQLLPSSGALSEFEESSERIFNAEGRLRAALEGCSADFDWVLLDCPPRATGVLCANAVAASDEVVLVVETGAFALQGALQALELLGHFGEEREANFDLSVLATLFDRRTRFAREVLLALKMRFEDALYDTVIRTSVRLREAAAVGQPIQLFSPRSRAATDFASLAKELLAIDKLRRSEPSSESIPASAQFRTQTS